MSEGDAPDPGVVNARVWGGGREVEFSVPAELLRASGKSPDSVLESVLETWEKVGKQTDPVNVTAGTAVGFVGEVAPSAIGNGEEGDGGIYPRPTRSRGRGTR